MTWKLAFCIFGIMLCLAIIGYEIYLISVLVDIFKVIVGG